MPLKLKNEPKWNNNQRDEKKSRFLYIKLKDSLLLPVFQSVVPSHFKELMSVRGPIGLYVMQILT